MITAKHHAASRHAENSGSYTFEPILASSTNDDCHNMIVNSPEEPSPTVSLYNLLDHSPSDLEYLLNCVRRRITDLEPNKLIMPSTYAALCAWAAIIETAIKERQAKDSEAWAEKTANEILDNDNCGPEHNV